MEQIFNKNVYGIFHQNSFRALLLSSVLISSACSSSQPGLLPSPLPPLLFSLGFSPIPPFLPPAPLPPLPPTLILPGPHHEGSPLSGGRGTVLFWKLQAHRALSVQAEGRDSRVAPASVPEMAWQASLGEGGPHVEQPWQSMRFRNGILLLDWNRREIPAAGGGWRWIEGE